MAENFNSAQHPISFEAARDDTELSLENQFRLVPFDASTFSDVELTIVRTSNASAIKESLQSFTRLDRDVRDLREVSTRGDYLWSIITDLGMTDSERPTKAYRSAFDDVHDKASDPRKIDAGELMDKYQDHPAMGFIDTLDAIASKSTATKTEIVMLRRTLLVLLDEYS